MDSFVAGHLRGVSRTYAILIPMLPAGLDEAVGLAYLLMRIVDTLEDAPQLSDEARRLHLCELDRTLAELGKEHPVGKPSFDAHLARVGELPAERELMSDGTEVLRRIANLNPEQRRAACICARKMIDGVLQMLERSRERGLPYPANRDAAELRQYCYYVAGVVGEMLCAMMSHHLKAAGLLRLRDVAVELGIGLQLVNILKDALKDSHQGRRYLPVAEGGKLAPAEIYRGVLAEARASLTKGAEFVLALPATAWELRSFCGLPIAWGAMTLSRAERDATQAKIGRRSIRHSIERFTRLAGDDAALRRWLGRLLREPPTARLAFE